MNLFYNYLLHSINQRNIPILDIGNKVGFTNYIDFITPIDMTFPIMKGIDIYGRHFLSIRVSILIQNESSIEGVSTIFERYTDSPTLAYGTFINYDTIFDDSRIRTNTDLENIITKINRLLLGETVKSCTKNIYLQFSEKRNEISLKINNYFNKGLFDNIVLPYI